jgi:ATP-dependent DNA helicase RecG
LKISPQQTVLNQVHLHPLSTPQASLKYTPGTLQIQKLIENMGEKYLSMTDMMSIFDLKDRKNFREIYVNPALSDGAIERLYPNEPTS